VVPASHEKIEDYDAYVKQQTTLANEKPVSNEVHKPSSEHQDTQATISHAQ